MILDTNALSALLDGEPGLEFLGECPELMIPVIVIGEYQFGLYQSKFRDQLEKELGILLSKANTLSVNEGTARNYAAVREELRQVGRTIPQNDLWIAALARQHHLPIVSRDVHFDKIKKVKRYGW
ncbi:MAG TPA: type II toxin-antitoxin system VapC family toxin [Verrucomicrobiales bacterium]|jgi:predicted nucleic acid-binding protein|nr:type II toxin-antitoxin system VapC family toxin [Verrucomicrobiales bacterium]